MQPLVLGTAQWGLDYGVTNRLGRLGDAVIDDLVAAAYESGVIWLDTAPAYGDAESRIAARAEGFRIATKVVGDGALSIEEQVRGSLARLERTCVDRVLVHDWPLLSAEQRAAVAASLGSAIEDGLIGAAGISAYVEDDLRAAVDDSGVLTIAQVPVNVLDQRLDESPVVADLRAAGWVIQARSVLLQGLLGGPSDAELALHPDVEAVAMQAQRREVSVLALALAYVRSRLWVDEIVVGATSSAELRGVVRAMSAPIPGGDLSWQSLASEDVDLIDPRRWAG